MRIPNIAVVLAFTCAASPASAQSPEATKPALAVPTYKAKTLARAEVDALLAKPDKLLIVDVRRPDELTRIGGFPVYLNVQSKDIEKYLAFIPKDRLIVTVSNHAVRAGVTADLLASKGFKVAGAVGVQNYEAEGGTLTKIAARTAGAGASSVPASFFVTSSTSATGKLGGLRGADARCQSLAAAAGLGSQTWRAYLSAEKDPDNANQPTDARSRIGKGPWFNTKGALVAQNVEELHARKGDFTLFVDEKGQPIPGNWPDSPTPSQHDILTGSTAEGKVQAGLTCADWTSDAPTDKAQVGHSDGLGRGGDTSGLRPSWNSAHESGSCADTSARGGAGRLYCFAVN
jgi:rhodanese-related sulfurtransferase